jgi:Xaa-Pro aminopeptidase
MSNVARLPEPAEAGGRNLLIYGAPETCPDLFHAIPAGIGDPFLYAEVDGRRAAAISVLDADKVSAQGIEILDPFELGGDEILAAGVSRYEFDLEIALRACRRLGIGAALVPPEFPLGLADHLRAEGLELTVDPEPFVERRRVKSVAQVEGIRRAQAAADAAMAVGAHMIHGLESGLTSEDVRAAMQAVCAEHSCDLPDDVIVSHGPQGALGHEPGHGPIGEGEAVIVDIWPRDRVSRCWADMTRTFVAGGLPPAEEIVRWWELTRESLDRVFAEVRAGADCQALYALSCEPFEAAGLPTQRTKPAGTKLDEGYYHSLGHGVGLEVHERPMLGRTPDTLVVGDVVTLEPGCYRKDLGGVRLEDLVLVAEDGAVLLTDFPYDL